MRVKKASTKQKSLRLTSLLLSLCMIVSLLPVSIFAAGEGEVVDAAVIFSDLHTTSSNYKESTLKGIMTAIKNTGLPISSVTSAGDAFSVNSGSGYTGYTSTLTGYIQGVLGNVPVNYVWSDHDRCAVQEDDKTLLSNDSGMVYGAGADGKYGTEDDANYYIYSLSMADLSTNNRYNADFHSDAEVTATIADFTATVSGLNKDRPLFIASHQPLLDRRNDNGHALEWCTAINAAAEEMDIAFFFGHNHKYDVAGDYYYAKGSTMPVCKDSSGNAENVKLNFTHMCAGYMAPSSTGSTSNTTRQGVAVVMTIYEDAINYTTYDANGVYTGNYALNETVTRDFVEKTVTYADTLVTINATSPGLTDIEAKNVTSTLDLSSTFTDYIAYKIELTGHTEGKEIKYSMLALDDMDLTNLALYYIDENNELIPVQFELVTDTENVLQGQYLEFTTTYDGVFVYGAAAMPEGYTLASINVSNVITTKYLAGDSLDLVNPVVTATYTKDGCEDYTRTIFIQDDYVTFDGYTVSGFDMEKPGKQTVVITYGEAETSFDIEVFQRIFPDESTGVSIEVSVPGATALSVRESANESVADSVALVLKADSYVSYDIGLDGHTEGDSVTVTLPIPEGVTNPAVYYVPDNGGEAVNMNAQDNGDGTVSFKTDHFSFYVIGDNLVNEEPEQSVTTGGTTYEEKTVYVRVDSFEDGEKYLLIGEDGPLNGNPIALVNSNGSDIITPVTVNTDSITVDGVTYSKGYIELDNSNAVFTASGSSSNGYTLKNGNHYIGGDGATTLHSSAVRVTYDANAARLKTASGTTRYLYYSTHGTETWKWSTSSSSFTSSRAMYIYKQVTTQIPTSNEITYTMQASNLDVILPETGTTTGQLEYALLANGKAATLPSGDSYTFGVAGDTNSIISDISNTGEITFSGEEGSCRVKIAYTWGENTVYKYVTVTARKPFYALEITDETTGAVITTTQSAKGDVAGTTRDYSAKLLLNGNTESEIDLSKVVWSSSNEAIATVDANGVVTFAGGEGTVQITATYEHSDAILTDTINIYVTGDTYTYPTDGTNDFPEYPNEGAIRFDKTAEAVGTFSETGVAKLELSMTGVPYTTNNKLDVVLMLDRSSSMTETRINATKAAVKVFIKNIVMNEDGSFNGNRIFIGDFLGGNPEYAGQSQHDFKITTYTTNEEDGYQIVDSTDEYNALLAKVDSDFVRQGDRYGTEYAKSLEYCYDLLNETKSDGNKQFCVFMSDGIPNVFQYSETGKYESTKTLAEMFTGTNYNTRSSKYHYEYHSTRMKANGVTVFSVGLGLENTNTAWSGVSATGCLNAASLMLNDISGPAGEAAPDTGTTLSKKDEYFFSVADADAAAGMENVFSNIAKKILEAATNVVVTDKVNDEYTMVFDIPQGPYGDHNEAVKKALEDQEFYIEFLEYALDANHERTTSTSKLKLYLGKTDNTYYAATANDSTNDANKFADPVFTAKTGDARAYWSAVDENYVAKDKEIVITVGETAYKFIENGSGTHNVTSGAYACGTIDATTKMSTDLVIVTPYFAYSAETRMLAWTVEKLTTVEYALTYFLYLDNSATDIGEDTETPEGPYLTNEFAYITYTNFNGNECRQEFPKPQLTWNGAQVSYVFYLVNDQGQPINKSGQVVDFANATFVTDVHTKHVIWNDDETTKDKEGKAYLDANYEAESLLSGDYTLYDSDASYVLLVYEDHEGSDLKNYFTIDGSEANGNVSSTTKVYNTKAGTKYSAYGKYTKDNVADSFDFGHTTVAFAVVWDPALVPDTVVVDFGLDVLIDVVRNDLLQNTVSGISISDASYVKDKTAMNTGVSSTAKFGSAALTIDGNTITIEDENRIRFHQGDMEFNRPVTFYYESPVKFYENSNERNGYLYSSVTVIPATTIYYEDSFVDFDVYTKRDNIWAVDNSKNWATDGTTTNATQDQDRPGESQISAALDADNNYGYDSAYTKMSTYSMGSARYITANATTYGTATFTFYGTGFDIISLTSNNTGTITTKVYRGAEASGSSIKNKAVDTYYGYTKDAEGNWVVDANAKNALYQVPVITVEDLEYGQYTVVIKAAWNDALDHVDGSTDYNFYLDAIRIYDPANDGAANTVTKDAYVADGEGWPEYTELRNLVIDKATFDSLNSDSVNGIVFIDGNAEVDDDEIADYISYGPNNELYLAAGQAVAGALNAGDATSVQLAIKTVGGSASVEVYGVDSSGNKTACLSETISTATDLYYDITTLNGKTLVIKNSGSSGIVSITNIKCTYDEAPVYPISMELTGENAVVTYSNQTTKTHPISELKSVTNEETITYSYVEKVHSKTYTVTVTVAANNEEETASYSLMTMSVDEEEESSLYLLSVSNETATVALMSLRTVSVEEDTEVEETPEESIPEAEKPKPGKPEKPGKDKPNKPNKPDKPDNPNKGPQNNSGNNKNNGKNNNRSNGRYF